ncbi:flavin reductase family protein [Dictyobacter aurantiacus]|uniref:Flavin reductase like domain-containing protein n=1 Tax=Dictyobacter aurantiacus TaxID=1936993 RepID=A0A401Z7X2_9CHLR|nr:flavin reductase family protein [Dictyobacter aurantiacus]GCE02961.1 hypothetical protein KDAU_02900 [Dictyobacter aurantiacus]
MAIEKELFRQVMGRFATGVTVVTTSSNDVLAGLTVNSFCSVSLNPPLVLICIDNNSSTLPFLRESKIFAVNMLTKHQEQWSRGFATNSPERFEHFCNAPHYTVATGAPIIKDVLAFIDARIVAEYPGGDHVIFLGQVVAMGTPQQMGFVDEHGNVQPAPDSQPATNGHGIHKDEEPLLYYGGQYRHLARLFHEPSLIEEQHSKNVGEAARN